MFSAEASNVSPHVYPGAVAHLSAAAEASPGVWLNVATLALAEAGAGVEQLRTFRAQAMTVGAGALLSVICDWMQIA
ncbi:hypothetical protein [Ornithinimicrobium murale]|uniref:hypothetical protein n=1 Tax=Ornithinimicrobium murale TaxID=1050153 RepID=UPI000E0D3BE1|nr:hypothetical protein [Ornithinimicrobium murale]